MKTYQRLIISLLVFPIFIIHSVADEQPVPVKHVDSKQLVQEKKENRESFLSQLKSADKNKRIIAIHEIGKFDDDESIASLINHFKTISSWFESMDEQQKEKKAIIAELGAKIKNSKVKNFFIEILKEEVVSLQKAAEKKVEPYYPKDIFFLVLGFFKKADLPNDLLTDFSKDDRLSPEFRAKILTFIITSKDDDNQETRNMHISSALDAIKPPPEFFIPWEIYNDSEKRKAYPIKDKMVLFSKWRKSETGIKSIAHKDILIQIGMPSVEAILARIKEGKINNHETGYYLLVSTEIIRNQLCKNNLKMEQKYVNLIKEVFLYIDKLDNKGAFCWRSDAGANINEVYKKLGLSEKIIISP